MTHLANGEAAKRRADLAMPFGFHGLLNEVRYVCGV